MLWGNLPPTTTSRKTASTLFELGVPIRGVDRREERQPFTMAPEAPGLEHERSPVRPERLAQKLHARFFRRGSALVAVAAQTRADDVLPRRRTALRSRDD